MKMILTQTRATYAGLCMYNVLRSIINVTILLSAATGQSQDHVARPRINTYRLRIWVF